MGMDSLVMLVSRFIVGAAATFFAILLWSRTRDIGWIFVGLGAIAGYFEVLYTGLKNFGIIHPTFLVVHQVPLLDVGLANLPFLLITLGLGITAVRKFPR